MLPCVQAVFSSSSASWSMPGPYFSGAEIGTLERRWSLGFSFLDERDANSSSYFGHDLFPYAIGVLLYFGFYSKDDSGAEKENTSVLQQNPSLSGSRNGEENVIDNPYLRPVKKPKIRRKK